MRQNSGKKKEFWPKFQDFPLFPSNDVDKEISPKKVGNSGGFSSKKMEIWEKSGILGIFLKNKKKKEFGKNQEFWSFHPPPPKKWEFWGFSVDFFGEFRGFFWDAGFLEKARKKGE